MKHSRIILTAITLALIATCIGSAQAQTISVLHTFSNDQNGSTPNGIIQDGDTLYGVTETNPATIYSVKTDGTGFTMLHALMEIEGTAVIGRPFLTGGALYGAARYGGQNDNGSIWKVNTDGSNFTVLHDFSVIDGFGINTGGSRPLGAVIVDGGKIYGTTEAGGDMGAGVIYSLNTDGSGFTTLHHMFTRGGNDSSARLILSGAKLYGAARYEGDFNRGAIFSIDTDGSNYTVLHSFATNANGYHPIAGLTLSGSTLYGVTSAGVGVYGTLYKIETDGTGFAVIHSFTGAPNGARSALTEPAVSGDTIYGVSFGGGTEDKGTVYSVKTDGTEFSLLHSFTFLGAEAYNPYSTPSLSGATLYGTARAGGGTDKRGTVWKIELLEECAQAYLDIQTYSGLTITGAVGCVYQIEWRPNNGMNTPWTPLTTITLTSSPEFFLDPTPVQGNRFYRAVAQ